MKKQLLFYLVILLLPFSVLGQNFKSATDLNQFLVNEAKQIFFEKAFKDNVDDLVKFRQKNILQHTNMDFSDSTLYTQGQLLSVNTYHGMNNSSSWKGIVISIYNTQFPNEIKHLDLSNEDFKELSNLISKLSDMSLDSNEFVVKKFKESLIVEVGNSGFSKVFTFWIDSVTSCSFYTSTWNQVVRRQKNFDQ